jgi:hypothetical protein
LPSDGANIAACWADFEKMWTWRRKQLDGGWIEVTVSNTEPTSDPRTHGIPRRH